MAQMDVFYKKFNRWITEISKLSRYMHLSRPNKKLIFFCYLHTLQKLEVCAWWNKLAKCFKICHIFGIWYENPCSFFRISFRATLFFSIMNALVCVDIGKKIKYIAWNEKRKKNIHGFSYSKIYKYGNWSISLGHFIKHKPLISEECAWFKYLQPRLLIIMCILLPSGLLKE